MTAYPRLRAGSICCALFPSSTSEQYTVTGKFAEVRQQLRRKITGLPGRDFPTLISHPLTPYDLLLNGLEARGFPTVHAQLPSCTNVDDADFPKCSLVDDALAVRSELIRLIEYENKSVVVVMHSYGGLVGSEAITQDLSCSNRRAQGLSGGVIYLFLYATFLLSEGQSVLDAFGESPNNDVKSDGRFTIRNGAQTLYNDLSPSEAEQWGSKLIMQSYKVQTTKLTRAAWRYIPSTYLICEGDQAAPPQYQEIFAANANSRVERCSAGHSPHLSQVDMLVQKIEGAAHRVISELE